MFGIDDAIIGAVGGSLVSGFLNNSGAASRQEDAQSFNAQQFATRYQTTVADMKAAGLNPMLAYSQGAGNGATSSAASSAGYGDLGNTLNQSRMTSAQVANIQADTSNKEAQADLIAAQAAQAWSSAGQADANTNLINETVGKVKAEIDKLKGDTNFESQQEILRNTAWNIYQQGALAQERGMSEGQSRSLMQATIGKVLSETKLNNLDIDAAEKFANSGRVSKELAPIVNMITSILRSRR